MAFIQTLPEGKLDIIGDVHGHYEALQNLLHYLGYNPDGSHPQKRKLIFVGDLVDRGPDSPAVLEWFIQANAKKNAFMVLGNHEINLLTGEAKDGSGWFFEHRREKDEVHYAPWKKLPENKKKQLLNFLQTQPLILQRKDLRIVHAAWDENAIQKLQETNAHTLTELHQEWEQSLHCCKHAPWYDDYLNEQRKYAHDLENPQITPPLLTATAQYESYHSRHNPVRTLSSGMEIPCDTPFFASGRWRFSIRSAWWDEYHDTVAVVIGHYWRQWHKHKTAPHRAKLFTVAPHHWHGAKGNVFCCDFSVGARWRDRKKNIAPCDSEHRLAALRWPEKTLFFDNGQILQTQYGKPS